jgi:hypothetical protein
MRARGAIDSHLRLCHAGHWLGTYFRVSLHQQATATVTSCAPEPRKLVMMCARRTPESDVAGVVRRVPSGRPVRRVPGGDRADCICACTEQASIASKSGMQPHSHHETGLPWRKGVRRHESTWENSGICVCGKRFGGYYVRPRQSTRETSTIMEKPSITSHKSHSPVAERLGVMRPGAPPPRWGSGAACSVDKSVPGEPRASRFGRLTTASAATAGTVTTSVAAARRRVRPTARLVARKDRAGLTRGSGVLLPVRGVLTGACQLAWAMRRHGFRRGQEAYSSSDATGIRRSGRLPLLSHCESLTSALDLQLTTMCNVSYV